VLLAYSNRKPPAIAQERLGSDPKSIQPSKFFLLCRYRGRFARTRAWLVINQYPDSILGSDRRRRVMLRACILLCAGLHMDPSGWEMTALTPLRDMSAATARVVLLLANGSMSLTTARTKIKQMIDMQFIACS
jgi:hypothetical protein